jgi:hypothetical protein
LSVSACSESTGPDSAATDTCSSGSNAAGMHGAQVSCGRRLP